jgi:hypothetical protein
MIPHLFFQAWSTTYWSLASLTSPEFRMHEAVCSLDNPRAKPSCPMPPEVLAALPHNRERSYKRLLQNSSSEKRQISLLLHRQKPAAWEHMSVSTYKSPSDGPCTSMHPTSEAAHLVYYPYFVSELNHGAAVSPPTSTMSMRTQRRA